MVPKMAGKKKLTIEEMRQIAHDRGGECLSEKYVTGKTKLTWECKKGHRWEAASTKIKSGQWCPFCIGRHQTIGDMQTIAKERKGTCLSLEYVNNSTKLTWECHKGHRWENTPAKIKSGQWCPHCSGRRQSIEDMREMAKSRLGKCLSNKYVTGKTKLTWECHKGHRWEAAPTDIKSGSWCPRCANENLGNSKRGNLLEMNNIAISRGGLCLSEKYVNARVKLKWKCAKGHTWSAIPDTVKNRGSWCPKCSKRKQQ